MTPGYPQYPKEKTSEPQSSRTPLLESSADGQHVLGYARADGRQVFAISVPASHVQNTHRNRKLPDQFGPLQEEKSLSVENGAGDDGGGEGRSSALGLSQTFGRLAQPTP